MDGPRRLHNLFAGRPEHFESAAPGLKLLLSLIVGDLSATKTEGANFQQVLERSVREFLIFESMNDSKHIRYAAQLLSDHKYLFLSSDVAAGLNEKPEPEKAAIFAAAEPAARLLWHFSVLLCRELFEGEHILTPEDAQLLGLVDEVPGGGQIESLREYKVAKALKATTLVSGGTTETSPNQT